MNFPSSVDDAKNGVTSLQRALTSLRTGSLAAADVAAQLGLPIATDEKAVEGRCVIELQLLQLEGLIETNQLKQAEAVLRAMQPTKADSRVVVYGARVKLAAGQRDAALLQLTQAGAEGVQQLAALKQLEGAKEAGNNAVLVCCCAFGSLWLLHCCRCLLYAACHCLTYAVATVCVMLLVLVYYRY